MVSRWSLANGSDWPWRQKKKKARLENDAATKRLRLAVETDAERKSRLEKMVATAQLMLALIKGVVDMGVVLSLKPF